MKVEKPVHSPFGPSKAHRWLHCHASIREEARYPSTTSVYAEEGSAAHRLAELCLRNMVEKKRRKPSYYIGKTCDETGLEYTQEMVDNVQVYLNIVFSLYDPITDEIYIETKLSAPSVGDNHYGTVDCIILKIKTKEIIVIDFKYGKGIAVDANENEQLLCYAMMAVETFSGIQWKYASQHIVQPRLDDPAMRHTQWAYKVSTLKKFRKEVKDAVKGANSPNPQYSPDEKRCHFCRAQVSCKALQEHTLKVMRQDFDFIEADTEFDFRDPETLSPDEIKAILDNKRLIETWLSSVQAFAIDSLEKDPGAVPGYKVVEGRSLRKWKYPELKTQKKLLSLFPDLSKKDLQSTKLLSVAQFEKLVGKKNADTIKLLVDKPSGKPTLVKASDSRPGISSIDDYE